jgi:hypothetical protein
MPDEQEAEAVDAADEAPKKPAKPSRPTTKKGAKAMRKKASKGRRAAAQPKRTSRQNVERPYPRVSLQEALQIPLALKEKNGGNPWSPDDVANALGVAKGNPRFFYTASAARMFGLTEGGRDSRVISLTPLGRDLVYAPSPVAEEALKRQAFLNVDVFKKVLDYYKGNNLPEMKYLGNTLTKEFQLQPETHEEFSELFRENCEYLNIGKGFATGDGDGQDGQRTRLERGTISFSEPQSHDVVTLAEPEGESALECFVIMPFRERDPAHPTGFFDEVLKSLIAPAGRQAGFKVNTANRQGSDVIQSTIINSLLNADLVLADLTEHNPNVLFELGMRMAHDKPVALIRAVGTGPIFDVDNMLRVYEYSPSLWATTIERDLPRLANHIRGTWEGRNSEHSYMKLLHRPRATALGAG